MSFGLTTKTRNAALLVAILSPCLWVTGQERAQDRRKFLDPATPVSLSKARKLWLVLRHGLL